MRVALLIVLSDLRGVRLVGLVVIVRVWVLDGARLQCGQLAGACYGLDIVGGRLLKTPILGKTIVLATWCGQAGDIKLIPSGVVLVPAGHALVAPAGPPDRTAGGVHQCWEWGWFRLGCWGL